MASSPSYAATPVAWCGLTPGTADTSWTNPSTVTQLGAAGTAGTKISQVDILAAGGTVVAGLVNIFLYDGTTYHLHEPVTIAPGTISTTAAPVKQTYTYDNLTLPTGWSMRITSTVAGNNSIVEVNAYGASL